MKEARSGSTASLSDAFRDNLRALRLAHVEEQACEAAAEAARAGRGHLAFLEELVAGEAALLADRAVARRIASARFPFIKTMTGWNWSAPRKINKMLVEQLLRLDFLRQNANVIFLGGVGLGKTHLAIALGHAACLNRHHVLFAPTIDVVNRLCSAHAARDLDREMRRYEKPRLLILDEFGYLPLDKRGAELLFQVLSKRYERSSTVITTNIPYAQWPKILAGDATLATALLDRLLHHAETVVIEGTSQRVSKQKQ